MNIKISKCTILDINKLIVFLLICSVFTMRPTALGQSFSAVSILIAIMALFIFILIDNNSKKIFNKSNRNNLMFFWALIFWIYCGIQSLLSNSLNIEFALKSIVINVSILIVFYVILSKDNINYYFFKSIISILLVFCISYYITLILSFKVGLDNLYLFKINIESYLSSGSVYFPFTIEYNRTFVNGFSVIRSLTFFREAGITQMFYIWGFFVSHIYFKRKKIVKIIMFLGVISCFSTAGFITFIFVYFINIFFNIKKYKFNIIFAVGILIICTILFINTKGISIQDKAVESINDRASAIIQTMEVLKDKPLFGVGYYSDNKNTTMGINFISSIYMIGIVGAILYFMIFISAYIKCKNKITFILAILPIIITSLFAQPLIDAPLIYIFVLANYNIEEKLIKK